MTTLRIANFEEIRTIEVEMINGIGIHLVGERDAFVKETLLRVVTALQSAGVSIPAKKIIINISAQSIYGEPKRVIGHEESHDLPIAIGILKEMGRLAYNVNELGFVAGGRLKLDGTIYGTDFNIKQIVK